MKRVLVAAVVACLAASSVAAQGAAGSLGGAFGEALNAVRAQAGLGRLRVDAVLSAAAQQQAERMAATGLVQHVGADGSTQITRAQRAGCRSPFVGENIAWGQTSAQATFDGWMASPGHRVNMMHPSYGVFGVGEAGGMWVIMFADRC